MQVVDFGLGGLVLAWPSPEDVPARLTIYRDGLPVDSIAVSRIAPGGAPLANLVDQREFLRRVSLATPATMPVDGARLGAGFSPDWSVTGEATPYCVRTQDGRGATMAWDLTEPLGLTGWSAVAGSLYGLTFDIAQHRCGVGLVVEWLDRDGARVGRDEVWRDEGPLGGRDTAGYQRLVLRTRCPGDATAVRVLLLQGMALSPPDAFVFFREPCLVEGDPTERPVMRVDAGFLAHDPGCYGVAPVGDALRIYGERLALSDGRTEVAVPTRSGLGPLLPFGLAMALEGRELVLEGAVGTDVVLPDRPVVVVVDDVVAASGTLRRRSFSYGARVPLAERLMDGGRRWIAVRDEVTGETLAAGALHLSSSQTPSALLRSAVSRTDAPGVLPFAEDRYRALAATIERLAATDAPAWLYAEVAAAHAVAMRGPEGENARFPSRRMPTHDRPSFSIVIPVHDKFPFTYFCLAAVLLTTAGLPVEVIVVDDGSTDRTGALEEHWEGVRVVRRETAGGFLRACTAGAAEARGDFLVFLNNDTEPTGRWLEELHLPFLAFRDVGMTGARLVYPDGRLQEAGGVVWNNGRPWNYGSGGNRADPRYNYARQADYLTGAAFMISRDAWNRAGGFSPEFEPAYYEDTDLAFKVRELGLRTVYAAKSLVIHYEGVSAGTDIGVGMKRFQEINRPKFEGKWRHRFRAHAAEGADPDREKDRGVIARALVLDEQPPRFDMDAGSLAISQEVRLLQSLGYKVTIAAKNMAQLGLYSETFERGGVEHLHAPFHTGLADVVARRAAEFDLVYVHRFQTATGLPDLIRRHAPKARILLNCADVHFLRQLRQARVLKSEDAFEAALVTRDAELAAFDEVDVVLTYSEVEKAVIESQLGLGAHVLVLPFVAGDADQPLPLGERADLGFIGSYDHPPNRDAVEWFVRECWPPLRERFPELRFRIAGSGFERFALAAEDDRIDLLGWVPDARAFAGARRVMVAPLRVGAGVKGKVVDALVAGTPGVLSEVAAEGLGLEPGVTAAVARTPADWVEAVSALVSDDVAWERMSRAGLEHARARHSFEAGRARFAQVLEAAGLPYDPDGRALHPVMSYDRLAALATAPFPR